MSVAYEPRNFIHEGAYPPIGDDQDPISDQRYTDSDVAEQLGHYTADAAMLQDDRGLLGDERSLLHDDASALQDADRLDLTADFHSPIPAPLPTPHMVEPIPESKDSSPALGSPSSARNKAISKPDRDVVKQADGKFHCPLEDCKEDIRTFARKCEWNKHMDKHERPYRCAAEGCENLPGFTYSGGLLRHEREVHGKYGGPKNTVNCPHPNCKRHTGKGFSRQENLNEHLRRVHTNIDGMTTPPADNAASPEEVDIEKPGMKRKRRSSGTEELMELRDEIKRVREENEKLKTEIEQQSETSLSMMAQIAELQQALEHGLRHHTMSGTEASMI